MTEEQPKQEGINVRIEWDKDKFDNMKPNNILGFLKTDWCIQVDCNLSVKEIDEVDR